MERSSGRSPVEASAASRLTAASFVASHGSSSSATLAAAAVHGYTTAFWWSAGIFFFGAMFSGVLLRSGRQIQEQAPAGAPAMAH